VRFERSAHGGPFFYSPNEQQSFARYLAISRMIVVCTLIATEEQAALRRDVHSTQ
jgi:hypothetical protein